ncbi:MAG: amino acid ABC transporter permease, partial [Firmicutes bacterium]|nr:amino acid ABC transporter permease [Bacillota bacterium]
MGIFRIFLSDKQGKTPPGKAVFNLFIAIAMILLFLYLSLLRTGYHFDFSILVRYKVWIWQGFFMIIKLSAVSLVLSLLLGLVSAVGRGSSWLPLRYLCDIYIKFIRG